MIRQTSRDAYNEIRTNGLLSQRRWEVYDALYKWGPCTANELYAHMTLKTRSTDQSNTNVRARLNELRECAAASEVGTRACKITGCNVIVWGISGKLPVALPKRESKDAIIKRLEEENKALRLQLIRKDKTNGTGKV